MIDVSETWLTNCAEELVNIHCKSKTGGGVV